jgi:hypothetical protein
MNEAEAHEFYADPDHLKASGPGERRRRPMKSGMIPVRFAPNVITAVKHFAAQDGVTVSTWIRRLVALELQRRRPPATAGASDAPLVDLTYPAALRPQSHTEAHYDVKELVA